MLQRLMRPGFLKTNATCNRVAFLIGLRRQIGNRQFAFFGEPVGGGREFFVAVYEAILLQMMNNSGRYIFGFTFEGVELEQFAAVEIAVGLEEMTGRHSLEDVFVGRAKAHLR